MMTLKVEPNDLRRLQSDPGQQIDLEIQGCAARAQVVIPHYLQHLKEFYGSIVLPDISEVAGSSGISFNFNGHFGLEIDFSEPAELHFHNSDLTFLGDCKKLIQSFGVVIVRNVRVDRASKDVGHRNRFPHLNFHRDRTENQPTPYSLYTRDPTDPEQCSSRISSTLFTANIVAYLQCLRENDHAQIGGKGLNSHYNIFANEDLEKAIGNILVEHRWDQPDGVGEISMLDNRTALHSSYLRNYPVHGYRIGVRYLS